MIKLFGSFFGFSEAIIGDGVIAARENEVEPAGKMAYDRIKIIVALGRFNPVARDATFCQMKVKPASLVESPTGAHGVLQSFTQSRFKSSFRLKDRHGGFGPPGSVAALTGKLR